MSAETLAAVAALLRARNEIDSQIAARIGRPMTSGHLGEWIAAQVFDIELTPTAVTAGYDGHFTGGPLAGRTVNVKWYLKQEGLLDLTESPDVHHYLVLTGPPSTTTSSRGGLRPWTLTSVHLFDAQSLLADLRTRGVKIGVASSVRRAQWKAAEIFPTPSNPALEVSLGQAAMLRLFGPNALGLMTGDPVT